MSASLIDDTSPTSPAVPPPSGPAEPTGPAQAVSAPSPAAARPPPPAMHSNPKITELQNMFPTVDPGVIEIVLESVGGSQDRAIEQLLSITDENFKAEEEVPGYRREAEQQVDLDEEFARSLQLEDEQSARTYQDQSYGGGQAGHTNPGAGGLPYQPRVRRNQTPQTQGQGYGSYGDERYTGEPGGPPNGVGVGMLQVEEKLQRAAEAGKQTFNNLFSLAKSKYAEFQQTQNQPQSQTQTQPQRSGGGLWAGEQGQGQGSAAGWGRGGSAGRGGVQNYGYGQQQNQGYNGRDDGGSFSTRSESFSSESTNDAPSDPRPVIRPSANRWTPSDTYEDALAPGRSTPTGTRGIQMNNPGGRQSPSAGVGSPENSRKIDASKLGILPKKKVDLLSSSPNSSALPPSQPKQEINLLDDHAQSSDPNPGIPGASHSVISKIPPTPPTKSRSQFELGDSDDELEYTRNPFDEK